MTRWTYNEWYAFGTMLLGVGAIVAGLWSFFNYLQTRRHNAAIWLNKLFSEFYIKTTFENIRTLLEYHYEDMIGPLIEKRITNRDIPINLNETNILKELDTLLNYFEHVLYLEQEKHLKSHDRQALLQYWFDLMSSDRCGGLRVYIANFGFERIQKELHCSPKMYIALYGTLMRGFNGLIESGAIDKVAFLKDCCIKGTLYDLGSYPGLIHGGRNISAELYEVSDFTAIQELDQFEQYYPSDRERSLYIRRCIRLCDEPFDAWVYFYNKDINNAVEIESGDWKEYVSRFPGKKSQKL